MNYIKALETIEKIAMMNNEDENNKALIDIYCIAHASIGNCKNKHEDWVELQKEIEIKLKDY